ncbi:allantoinase [Auriculariales sp. MPI-PUGE-AT-0066]|nr:allantoinase [Auriculariales sp. MPI-PUGE-AT-0066]
MSDVIIFTSSYVLLPDALEPAPATIEVSRASGRITRIAPGRAVQATYASDIEFHDAGDKTILPGLVDSHVHLNEPGRTDWEGFATGTRAAVSGGPLNSIPPTTTVENFYVKRKAAEGQCHADVAFWGGVIPGNQKDLKPLVEAGVRGFKCFLIESGVEEFPCVNETDLREALQQLEGTPAVLLFHAELEPHEPHADPQTHDDPTQYRTFLNSRPETLETDAIALVRKLHTEFPRVPKHIVHLSAASALPLIDDAPGLTAETCFHYLSLSTQVLDPASPVTGRPHFKCCPPIRDADNAEQLWAALREQRLACVVSDHSPCVPQLKRLAADGSDGDFMQAWGGISSLGLGFSIMWAQAGQRGVALKDLVHWMGVGAARIARLENRKGAIAVGMDADLVFWDLDKKWKVTKDKLHFKNKLSPYEGMTLRGVAEKTFLRGKLVWDDSNGFDGLNPKGILL